MQNFPRLTKLFGCRVDQLDEQAIRAAITARVPEGVDLDFKRTHHDEPGELAKDVAAFANSGGGVLVIGVAEVAILRSSQNQRHGYDARAEGPCRTRVTDVERLGVRRFQGRVGFVKSFGPSCPPHFGPRPPSARSHRPRRTWWTP
jgi:hypothetical protein